MKDVTLNVCMCKIIVFFMYAYKSVPGGSDVNQPRTDRALVKCSVKTAGGATGPCKSS